MKFVDSTVADLIDLNWSVQVAICNKSTWCPSHFARQWKPILFGETLNTHYGCSDDLKSFPAYATGCPKACRTSFPRRELARSNVSFAASTVPYLESRSFNSQKVWISDSPSTSISMAFKLGSSISCQVFHDLRLLASKVQLPLSAELHLVRTLLQTHYGPLF